MGRFQLSLTPLTQTSSYATGHHAFLSACKTYKRKYAVKLFGNAFYCNNRIGSLSFGDFDIGNKKKSVMEISILEMGQNKNTRHY